jgi:hypothetical protein
MYVNIYWQNSEAPYHFSFRVMMTARPYYGAGGFSRTEEAPKDDGEGRKRKGGTRRTVDYGCTNAKWLMERLCQRSPNDEKSMRPGLNEVINVFFLVVRTNGRCYLLRHTELILPRLSQ